MSCRSTRMYVALVMGLVGTWVTTAYADDANDVVFIEEQWELTVGGPEIDRCAPQVSLVMSPTGDLDGVHFVFLLNHSTFPDFVAGGLQMQCWNGDSLMYTTNSSNSDILSYDNETVSWVQKLRLQDGNVVFDVDDGQSETWGAFGNGDGLYMHTGYTMDRLNEYRPAVSLGESGITFAGNRVSSLVLKKLIWKTADGTTNEMVAPIDIDTDIDP